MCVVKSANYMCLIKKKHTYIFCVCVCVNTEISDRLVNYIHFIR